MVKQLRASISVQKIVNDIAQGIAEDNISPFDAMLDFCRLCEALRSGKLICDWHKNSLKVPESCNVCPTTIKKD
jgi:hypothetical protein